MTIHLLRLQFLGAEEKKTIEYAIASTVLGEEGGDAALMRSSTVCAFPVGAYRVATISIVF